MNPEGQSCGTCLYFDPKPGQEIGACRLTPPMRLEAGKSCFVPTHAESWCGQWARATAGQLKHRQDNLTPRPPEPAPSGPKWSKPPETIGVPETPKLPKPTSDEPLLVEGRPVRNFGVAKKPFVPDVTCNP